jgi:hypothetical protein
MVFDGGTCGPHYRGFKPSREFREDGIMYRFLLFSISCALIYAPAAFGASGSYTGPGFSAKLAIQDPHLGDGRYFGTYYFDRGGYRIEINGRARYNKYIFNSFHEYSITVGSNGRMQIDVDKHGALSLQFGDAPCAGFKRAVNIGPDNRGGREIQVWRCASPKQELLDAGFSRDYKSTVWYDLGLKHFVRKESNNGVSITLTKIVPGRQSPILFDNPEQTGPAKASSRIADVETVE